MDARRRQVYTGLYQMEQGIHIQLEQQPMDMGDLAEELNRRGERVIFLGDGVPAYREMIQEMVKVPFEFAPAQMNRQRAASVAALGSLALKEEGDGCGYHSAFLVSAGEFNPDYLRKSQAERQREAELSPEGAAGKLPGDY